MLNCIETTKESRRRRVERLVLGVISAAALALCAAGCAATVEAEPAYAYSTVAVEAPPAYETYPRYYYDGSYAYLVGDRWYYDSPRGWVIFQAEPRVLVERRAHIRRSRHPATRRDRPRYYDERRAPASPREPRERGRRRYYQD